MSNRYLTWVWHEVPNLTNAEKLVLLSLADQANDDGWANPSQTYTAVRCGMTRQSVCNHIGSLRKKGLLELHRGKGNKVTYTLSGNLTSGPKEMSAQLTTDVSSPDISIIDRTHIEPTYQSKTTSSPDSEKSGSSEPACSNFEANEILELYPRYRLTRKEKAMCRGQIYLLVKKGFTPAQIKDRTEDFRFCHDYVRKNGGKPFPWHPLKFFSDPDRVADPMTWRSALSGDADDDEWEEMLYHNSIPYDPTPYKGKEDND